MRGRYCFAFGSALATRAFAFAPQHQPTRFYRCGGDTTFGASSLATTETNNNEAWKSELELTQLQSLLKTAVKAARAAGTVIQNHLGCAVDEMCNIEGTEYKVKTTIKDIVTQYDSEAQVAVETILRGAYPTHDFLGEENVAPGGAASEQALQDALASSSSDYLWICDPIDGTANFAAGLDLCAVTVSLLYKGTAVVGVIYDPHRNELFSTIRGQGAFLNEIEPLCVALAVTDMKDAIINAGCPADPVAFGVSVRGIQALNSQCRGLRMIACSALTTAWIASGRLTAHFGYDLSSWDLIAGALLIQEAGGRVTDLDGSPYQVTTRNMLCSNREVHDEVLQVLKEADAVSFERAASSG